MSVFLIGGIKGGTGKSTIVESFTVWLSRQGFDVLLVDSDEQETVSDFTAWREETLEGNIGYTLVQLNGSNVRKQIESLRPKYDHIVIDTGGRDTSSQRAALIAADVVLLPFQPRSHDIWTIDKINTLLDEIQSVRPTPLTVFSFLNRADITSADNREAVQVLEEQESMIFLPALVKNRKAYPNAASKGLTVFETEVIDQKAVDEVNDLFTTILNYGNK